jgi:hypothetical protein
MISPLNFEKSIVKVGSCCNWLTAAFSVVFLVAVAKFSVYSK